MKKILLIAALTFGQLSLAKHYLEHLDKAELIEVVLLKDQVIECLEQELETIKHTLHKEHRFHKLKKFILEYIAGNEKI